MHIPRYPVRSLLFLLLGIAVGIAGVLAAGTLFRNHGPERTSGSAHRGSIGDRGEGQPAGKPLGTETVAAKALRVRHAIREGDYPTARRIVAQIISQSRLQYWRYYPFGNFIKDIADVNDPALEPALTKWVESADKDAVPLLIRARYEFSMAWSRRGHAYSSNVRPADLTAFRGYMNKALADTQASIRLNDEIPYGFELELWILHGFGPSPSMADAFAQGIAKYPDYYPLYDAVLRSLEPKWGGNIEAMYAFADRYAGKAPKTSALRLLYLLLYRNLLNAAAAGCSPRIGDNGKSNPCISAMMDRIVRPELEREVVSALRLGDHTDRYQFGIALEDILSDMLATRGGDRYSGAVLQLAASALHSDTQLMEDHPGSNYYIVDEAAAESWTHKGFYDNAKSKYREALSDLEHAEFPSVEEHDWAKARIYDKLAEVSDYLNEYRELIGYEKAAIALGGSDDGAYLCYGYYKVRRYDQAIAACTTALERTGRLRPRYWRAQAYWRSGRIDAALRDLDLVAGSESNFRSSAAINLSYLFAKKKDLKRELEILNKYDYLYDSKTQTPQNIAAAYNNRCYAYMHLGELRKALADCTQSLKYGSLPDAYRKQQRLIELLRNRGVTGKQL